MKKTLNLEGCKMDRGKTRGILIDFELNFDEMVSKVCQAEYSQLSHLRNLRTVSGNNKKLLVVKSLIVGKINYYNSLYAGAKIKQLKPLHNLLNATVRFILSLPKSTPITQFLAQGHTLPFPYRIKYKLFYYMYKVTYGSALGYLSVLFHQCLQPIWNLLSASNEFALATNSSQGTTAGHKCDEWNAL